MQDVRGSGVNSVRRLFDRILRREFEQEQPAVIIMEESLASLSVEERAALCNHEWQPIHSKGGPYLCEGCGYPIKESYCPKCHIYCEQCPCGASDWFNGWSRYRCEVFAERKARRDAS
jgi:hypothetical protein